MPTSPSVKIAVTLGDPAGIGPEVAVKALHLWPAAQKADLLLLGKASFYRNLARKLRLPVLFEDLKAPADWKSGRSFIPCFFPYEFPSSLSRGTSQPALARAAVQSIELAAKLARQKKVSAIVTPPIHKAGLKKAGFAIPGHTEFLAKLSGTKRFEMMLVGGRLRVVLVTRHMAIKKVPQHVTKSRVTEAILLTDRELRKHFGIPRPRIAVCGLNPHAGEEGHLGREEMDEIAPAVRDARKKTNAQITGPLPPDVLFYHAYLGQYDAEICMYHDQGLIPLKMISRGAGVNVTLGLPYVRTSPDHGTAYDIANRYIADPGSMVSALDLAVSLCVHKRKYDAHRRN